MVERLQNQVEKEERDMKILRAVIESGPIGIVKLSDRTGLPEHKVRYSLRMLENDGFVEPTPDGATAGEDIEAKVEAVNEGLARLIERLGGLPNADIADRVDAK
jgi:predicted transcriptional regulator